MAGLISKRQREDQKRELGDDDFEELKRQKSYNQILSILDHEEDQAEADHQEPIIEDLDSIITTLQQEISSPNHHNSQEEEEEEVLRHLLEASDDELGIINPNNNNADHHHHEFGSLHHPHLPFPDDALIWELEDEAANYYTLFHSQLFM